MAIALVYLASKGDRRSPTEERFMGKFEKELQKQGDRALWENSSEV